MDRNKRIALLLLRRHYTYLNRRQRRYWIHPLSVAMNPDGEYFSRKYEALKLDEKEFFDFFRMSVSSFEELLNKLSPYIQKNKLKGRKPVAALEMLGYHFLSMHIDLHHTNRHETFPCLSTVQSLMILQNK
ncbi:hypothetical protein ABMA27_016441 [Loxostege sticticalis]|uniref:Uncharacterized protein n=1 Tax=Loxostege sticticalis TaxID=481309 RepID=A0ABR3I297_LOXSC